MPDGDPCTQKAGIVNKEKTMELSLLCYHGPQGRVPYLEGVMVERESERNREGDQQRTGR